MRQGLRTCELTKLTRIFTFLVRSNAGTQTGTHRVHMWHMPRHATVRFPADRVAGVGRLPASKQIDRVAAQCRTAAIRASRAGVDHRAAAYRREVKDRARPVAVPRLHATP